MLPSVNAFWKRPGPHAGQMLLPRSRVPPSSVDFNLPDRTAMNPPWLLEVFDPEVTCR
jgi:hypothetical protein